MNKIINPCRVEGVLQAPASKSYLQRALALAALANQSSILRNCSECDDVVAARSIISAMGATIEGDIDWTINPVKKQQPKPLTFHAGESGLSLRLFSFIAPLCKVSVTMTGHGSLINRPIKPLLDALTAAGVTFDAPDEKLPMTIDGPIRNSSILLDGSFSSQILSGLLMTAPMLAQDTTIHVENLTSRPYVEMTLDIMRQFGVLATNDDFKRFYIQGNQQYQACHYSVEADWSAAANFLVAAAVSGSIVVAGLNADSLQADKKILNALTDFGAQVQWTNTGLSVSKNQLRPFTFDASDCPDLFPPLVVLAAAAHGRSVISGTHRLIHKESNRLESLLSLFTTLGLKMETSAEDLIIYGTGQLCGGTADGCNDHRLVMCAAIASVLADSSIEIQHAEAVTKSFPKFFDDLENLMIFL